MPRRRSVRRLGSSKLTSRTYGAGSGQFRSTAQLNQSAGYARFTVEPPRRWWMFLVWIAGVAGAIAFIYGVIKLLFGIPA